MAESCSGDHAHSTRDIEIHVTNSGTLEADPGCPRLFSNNAQRSSIGDPNSTAVGGTTHYPCKASGCGKSFSSKSSHRHHAICHDPERRRSYKCSQPGCRAAFRYPKDLLRHHRTVHAEIASLPCPVIGCGRSFFRKDHLRRHQRGVHLDAHIQTIQQPAYQAAATPEPKADCTVSSVEDPYHYSIEAPTRTPNSVRRIYGGRHGEGADSSGRCASITIDGHAGHEDDTTTSIQGQVPCRPFRESAHPGTASLTGSTETRPYSTRPYSQVEVPSERESVSSHTGVETSDGCGRVNNSPPDDIDEKPMCTNVRQTQKPLTSGKVIPCPLGPQNGCSGKDENMASLERKLKSKGHDIYYHNKCKTLLSAPPAHPQSDNPERPCKSREENEQRWSSHTKECHAEFCVVTACAPDLSGDLRHERTAKCKPTRGDVKQAEFNYLCHTLGVAQQAVEPGSKCDHKGQRKPPRSLRASMPLETIVEDGSRAETDSACFQRDNARLRRDKERLQKSVQRLEEIQQEHLSIMKHLLHDMINSNVELSDVVRDRLERHAPSALHKQSRGTVHHTPRQQVHGYPYTPSPSAAPSALLRSGRAISISTGWTPSPSGEPLQDLHTGDHSTLPAPLKRRRIDLSTPDDGQFSMVSGYHDSTPGLTSMSFASTSQPINGPVREQADLFPSYEQGHARTSDWRPEIQVIMPTQHTDNASMDQEPFNLVSRAGRVRQQPASEPMHPEGIDIPPSTEHDSQTPSYQHPHDRWEWPMPLREYQAKDSREPHDLQESGQPYSDFVDTSFDSGTCNDWNLDDDGVAGWG